MFEIQIRSDMKKALIILSVLGLFAVSCGKTEEPKDDNAGVVGEWSTGRADNEGNVDVRMHISLKADMTYTLTMPAWDEQRFGTYTVDDKQFVLTCNKIEYVLHWANDGYRNAYDRYTCVGEEKMPDFADFAKERPEEVEMTVKYTLKDGNLYLDGLFGMSPDEPFFPNPKFDAETEVRKHIVIYE